MASLTGRAVVFVRYKGFIPWLIRTVTWSHWDHICFETSKGFLAASSSDGVEFYRLDHGLCEVERFTVEGLDLDLAVQAAASQIGKPYDWPGVLGLGFHRDWQSTDSWFCSEIVAWACRQAGVDLLRFDHLRRVTPGELALSPLLRPIL